MNPSVYPTGTTIFYPEKCWNGYTVFQGSLFEGDTVGAVLIDMNGNVVNQWKGLDGFPNKMLPGGFVMGSTGMRNPKYGFQDMLDLVQVDWNGKIVWKYNKYERIKDPRRKPVWMARQHHDYQRSGNPVGYYAPGMEPKTGSGNTIILTHKNLKKKEISEKPILDDAIIEVDWAGKKIWEWTCSDHFDELGFDEQAKNVLARNPGIMPGPKETPGDWMHLNSVSFVGPNNWYDKGDNRFRPENIIWSSRQANIIGITEKKTGKIVWKTGPDYSRPELLNLGWIIGQHHAHMIPRGLPGEGNILVFDNGGYGGYGSPNPGSPAGVSNAIRDHSRVIEFDPVTFKIVWQSGMPGMPGENPGNPVISIYSRFISSAQRLANGNTLITEGNGGRIIEVTPKLEIVWEYISPYKMKKMMNMTMVYRAYRLPYEWAPQAEPSEEKAVLRIENSNFHVPGVNSSKPGKITVIKKK